MKLIYCIGLLVISASTVFGQGTITGIVKEETTGKSLPGVNVYIPEIRKGRVTDINGKYILEDVPVGYLKIRFSFIGYETIIRTINISKDQLTVDISMAPSAIETQEITISSGRTGTQHENATKIESISKQQLQFAQSENIVKKLSSVPGIDAISNGNGIASPVIRGLSTSNIVVLNNGIRMENYQFSANHPYMIDESDISTVEIIKGPASLLYGSDAVGGVINFVKEPPALVDAIAGNYSLKYNTNYSGISTSLGLKGSQNNYFWGANGYINSEKDYFDGRNIQVPNSRNKAESVKVFGGYRKSFGIFSIYFDYNHITPGIVNEKSILLVEDNNRKNEIWYQDLDNYLVSSKNTLFLSKWQLNIDLSYQNNKRQLQTSQFTPAFTMVHMLLDNFSYQAKTKYDFSEHSNITLLMQGSLESNENVEAPEHVLPDFNETDQSLAGLWHYNFKENTFFQFGIRYDYKYLNVPEQDNGHDDENMVEKFEKTYNNLSFSTGATYKLSKTLLLRANIASAFRTPNVAELMQDGLHGNRYEQGDPNLVPQRNIEADLSLHFHTHKLKVEIAGFYNRIFDYIYLSPTTDTTNSGTKIYRYLQNNATIYGFEGDVKYNILKGFIVSLNYSHLYAKQDNGNYLPFIPQDKLNLNLGFKKALKKSLKQLQFDLGSEIAFKQNRPSEFETPTAGYIILNASVSLNMKMKKKKFQISCFGHNLLNTSYYDHLSTIKELGFYNMGRNIGIKITVPINISTKN